MTSLQGSITWEGIVAQTAGARQVARHYPNGLPWLTETGAGIPEGSEPESDSPDAKVDREESDVTAHEQAAPTRPRH